MSTTTTSRRPTAKTATPPKQPSTAIIPIELPVELEPVAPVELIRLPVTLRVPTAFELARVATTTDLLRRGLLRLVVVRGVAVIVSAPIHPAKLSPGGRVEGRGVES